MFLSKLRLVGFKSFVDSTILDIEPGVTGVVGPNGCGKSNLVEGLRWVMGETSAKQMRGGEMDDVIFGGTTDRPARNIAEAVLTLDNSDRTAPAQFNDQLQLDISRRIEREKGSTYRVNGKEVRARDVQLLFADVATGARSTALVSQGRIGQIVSAKPTDRRQILEEAAGITGLHSRRHEAELRLRGAETNLERLDDILVTLDAQLQSLKKQLRQARRYTSVNEHIRKAEATLFLIRWTAAALALKTAQGNFTETEGIVADKTAAAAHAATAQAEASTGLPQLRQAEAEAAAALQRLTLARESLDTEEKRLEEAKRECELRLSQVAEDIMREQRLIADSDEALKRLAEEQAAIEAEQDAFEKSSEEAEEQLRQARASAESCEERMRFLTDKVAHANARQESLEGQQQDMRGRVQRLSEMRDDISGQVDALAGQADRADELAEAEARLRQTEEDLEAARTAANEANEARSASARILSDAHETARTASESAARVEAEVNALANLLGSDDPDLWPPMIDAVTVQPGYELALGAALGEDLTAATDEAAPIHWQTLPPLGSVSPLPAGAEPLGNYVTGPSALVRRLAHIGLVADDQTGARLASQLQPGHRLVSRDGALWRWDGYTTAADASTTAAKRLEQRNRLNELQSQLKSHQDKATAANDAVNAARQAADVATQRDEQTRAGLTSAQARATEAREILTALQRQIGEAESKRQSMTEALERIDGDLNEARTALKSAEEELARAPEAEVSEEEMVSAGSELNETRAAFVDAQSTFEVIRRRSEERKSRLQVIVGEIATWTKRREESDQQRTQLEERRSNLSAERERLAKQPDELSQRRSALVDKLEESEAARKQAADQLAEAENTLRAADQTLREAEAALAAVRENRVRSEANVTQAKLTSEALIERIRERLNARPDELLEISGNTEDASLPDDDAAEKRVERLIRERENMGPVNLRAEVESEELEEKIETLNTEREDLILAIEKLRRGISELNREGRTRLLQSF
ncbi:MAG: AAA family ATPase, partial [Proteobacteria bacterium]|nr:AAA family ATPase [Pseudomonadota bacterium]